MAVITTRSSIRPRHHHTTTTTTTTTTTLLFGCLLVMLLMCSPPAAAAPKCTVETNAPIVSESTCTSGVVVDWCNRPACGKGPGESCGGRYNANGLCGRGMFCGCGRCTGCNNLLDCYFNPKC